MHVLLLAVLEINGPNMNKVLFDLIGNELAVSLLQGGHCKCARRNKVPWRWTLHH